MRQGARALARLGRIVEIEGCMAQHRTRRTTAKASEQITPEQLRIAREWLEEAFRVGQGQPTTVLEQLSTHAPPTPLPALVEALSTMATPEAAALLTQIA